MPGGGLNLAFGPIQFNDAEAPPDFAPRIQKQRSQIHQTPGQGFLILQ